MNASTLRPVIVLAAATLIVGCSLVVLFGPAAPFTFIGRFPVVGVVAASAAVMTMASALAVAVMKPRWRSGVILAVGAVIWVSWEWIAWQQIPPTLTAVASAAVILGPAVIVHLAAGFADGSLQHGRPVVLTVYGIGVCAALIRLFAYDPFRDVMCWADCRRNPLAIVSAPWGDSLAMAVAAGSSSIGLFVILARRLRAGAKSTQWSGIAASAAISLLAVGYVLEVMALGVSQADPAQLLPAISLLVLSGGLSSLAVAHVAAASSAAARSRRLRTVVEGASLGSLEGLLANALRDASVRVIYRAGNAYVDATGAAMGPPIVTPALRLIRVQRGGEEVAVILHSVGAGDLGREIGPALRVALENESLRVALDVKLHELQLSSARIVATADARRRSLERDLHDGAQQDLIVLAWRLHAAARELSNSGDLASSRVLARAADEARGALRDLRDVSHGLHPAILTTDGVEGALRSLAHSTPLPLRVVGALPRFSPEAEAAVYSFGVAVVAALAARGCPQVEMTLAVTNGVAGITASAPGVTDVALDPIIADRLNAVGGVLTASEMSVRLPFSTVPAGVRTEPGVAAHL